jgi:hypothetical protein
MGGNETESLHEGQRVSVSFGIRGDSLVPEEVSLFLGLRASHAFAKGDEYHSVAGNRKRPWGVWQLRSELSVNSLNVADHARFLLDQLEPKREIIKRYIESKDFYVDIRIWCESYTETTSYTISSDILARLATLCEEFNFSSITRKY